MSDMVNVVVVVAETRTSERVPKQCEEGRDVRCLLKNTQQKARIS